MRKVLIGLACLGFLVAGSGVLADSVGLHSVDFPERTTVALTLTPQPGAPDAKMSAKVTYRDGQARIEVDYQNMKPAILYGGDVTCYVLWAVNRDGTSSNLGEILAETPKGKAEFVTGNKAFALLVTSEPYYLVRKPSALPVFANDPPDKKKFSSAPFVFSEFREATPRRAMESIREINWDSKVPLTLLQARKAIEIADALEADMYATQFYGEASEALAQANEQFDKSPGSRKLQDYARRSVALSNEAINISLHRIESIALEELIAERRAEMVALAKQAEQAERRAAELARETQELSAEQLRMSGEMENMGVLLESALTHVADTQNTARGIVVNLPDILFDLNKATLKPEAEVVMAKLSGILLIMQDLQVAVEGYTDSTGTPEYNLELSRRRAESVVEFMQEQGIAAERTRSMGFGMERPVAGNETEEGRRKNRRVEIVLSGG